VLFAWRLLRLGFRFLISILLLLATVGFGVAGGLFCYCWASEAIEPLLESLFGLNPMDVAIARRAVGGSVILPVIFFGWKRWPYIVGACSAAWRWIWMGGRPASKGLIRGLTRLAIVFVGIFFACFTIKPPKQCARAQKIVVTSQNEEPSPPDKLFGELRQQLTELKTIIEGRNDFIVYLDKTSRLNTSPPPERAEVGKTPSSGNAGQEIDLVYVALFDNASFQEGNRKGRVLSPREEARLKKFAESLRQIATKSAESKIERLKVDVRGFASDAPRAENQFLDRTRIDDLNRKLANDRTDYVYNILDKVFGGIGDLSKIKSWEKPAKMKEIRRYNDFSVRFQNPDLSALAEAPNRRVEILVTLPPELRYSVSTSEPPQIK
jgi:hypothetical protein